MVSRGNLRCYCNTVVFRVGGIWTKLRHPSTAVNDGEPWTPKVLQQQ